MIHPGSDFLASLWGEKSKRLFWRHMWCALARTEHRFGLVTEAELADIEAHQGDVDIPAALEKEKETFHEVMAEIFVFQNQCEVGGRVIHLGATSSDIVDNAEVLRMRASLRHLSRKLLTCGFPHLSEDLRCARRQILGKGIRGAVGTSASFKQLLDPHGVSVQAFEVMLSRELQLDFNPVATQVSPRKQEYKLITELILAGFDLVAVLGDQCKDRYRKAKWLWNNIVSYQRVAWDNAAHCYLERTLDDSANRRVIIPESFLMFDHMIELVKEVEWKGLRDVRTAPQR